MEELLPELERQSEILEALLEEIRGLRADMNTARKEAMENGIKNVMEQMSGAFKGTPLETMVPGFMARMKPGGKHGQ